MTLSLNRRCGESVMIQDNHEIVVHAFDDNEVVLIIQTLPQCDQAHVETLVTNGGFVMILPDVYVRATKRRNFPHHIVLDFKAPRSIAIDRDTIYYRKQVSKKGFLRLVPALWRTLRR
jgi:sRNA-binding carbon storage regulator CsrA